MVRRLIVAERSMAPTLEPGDRILVVDRAPTAGSLAVASAPGGLLVVKRVVAVGPATVAVSAGSVTVEGAEGWEPVDEVPGTGSWELPDGHVFLISDAPHRTDSDSRAWGPLADSDILGVAVWRYRPWRRWGRLGP